MIRSAISAVLALLILVLAATPVLAQSGPSGTQVADGTYQVIKSGGTLQGTAKASGNGTSGSKIEYRRGARTYEWNGTTQRYEDTASDQFITFLFNAGADRWEYNVWEPDGKGGYTNTEQGHLQ